MNIFGGNWPRRALKLSRVDPKFVTIGQRNFQLPGFEIYRGRRGFCSVRTLRRSRALVLWIEPALIRIHMTDCSLWHCRNDVESKCWSSRRNAYVAPVRKLLAHQTRHGKVCDLLRSVQFDYHGCLSRPHFRTDQSLIHDQFPFTSGNWKV